MGNYIQAESIGVQLVITIGAFLCETFFFGAYSTVFLYSSVLMLKRPTAPARNYMLAVSAFMYAVSAAHWAMNMAVITRILRVGIDFMSPFERLVVVYLPTINYILSDGIVVWRAWVLWGPSRRFTVFIPPLFSLVSTFVLSAAGAAYLYIGIEYESERDSAMSRYLVWTIWGLSVGTNIWATGLIYIQIWQHRQFIRSLLGKGTATSTAEKVLIFMVESGALYLCIWAVYIISTFTDWNGVHFLNTAIVQVVGIYPMTIVLFVTMRLSTADILSMSGSESSKLPIPIRLTSPDSLPIVGDVGGFLESGCDVAPHDGGLCTTVLQSEGDVDRTEEDPGHGIDPRSFFC